MRSSQRREDAVHTPVEKLKQRLEAMFPFVAGLPADLLDALLTRSKLVRIRAGAPILDKQEAGEVYPLVLSGSIRAAMLGEHGREVLLYRLGPGQGCAIPGGCLLHTGRFPIACSAESDVELLKVPHELFHRLLQESAAFRDHVCGLFAGRLLDLARAAEAGSLYKIDQRLAALLLSRAPRVKATHEALARDLGTAREVVGRILGDFADQGAVGLSRGQITVLDVERLKKIADGLV